MEEILNLSVFFFFTEVPIRANFILFKCTEINTCIVIGNVTKTNQYINKFIRYMSDNSIYLCTNLCNIRVF